METRSAKRRDSASSTESVDWDSESTPSTSHVSVTTAQTTRRTGSAPSVGHTSISSRRSDTSTHTSGSGSGKSNSSSERSSAREIIQDSGPELATTEMQTEDDFMYKSMQAALDNAYKEMKANSTDMDINLASGKYSIDDVHMMFVEERRQKFRVEKKYKDMESNVHMLEMSLKLFALQAESGFVNRHTMKFLKDWDYGHMDKDQVAHPKLFQLSNTNAEVRGLENTLRFVLRVSAGYDDGREYLRRVLPILRRQIQQLETEPLRTVGESGVKALVQVMNMYQGDEKIQGELCMIVNILIGEDQGRHLAKHGTGDAVMTAMAIHQRNPVILEWGLEVLLGLVQSGPEVRAALLRQPSESFQYTSGVSDPVAAIAKTIDPEEPTQIPISLQGVITLVLATKYKIRSLAALSLAIVYTLLREEEERMKGDLEGTELPALIVQAHMAHPKDMDFKGVFNEQRHWVSTAVQREEDRKRKAAAKAKKLLGLF